MIEARIVYACTCDFCGEFGRREISAAVPAPWIKPPVLLPEGWTVEKVVGPNGTVEKHRCNGPTCKARGEGHEPNAEQQEFAKRLAAETPPGERA